jgi:hypothetical protein
MRIIHHSPFRDSDGTITQDEKAARLALGADWRRALQSEDVVIQTLAENLDDDYVLICNLTLPGLKHETDMILFSTRGIWLFQFFYLEGLYRTNGERLFAYNSSIQRFKRCKPDVIAQLYDSAAALSQTLDSSLSDQNIRAPWITPIILLLNPKATIQVADTATTTILRPPDLYEFSARAVKKLSEVISVEELGTILDLFQTVIQSVEPASPRKKTFTRRGKRRLGLNIKQWTLLFIILIIACLILGVIGVLAFQTPALQAILLSLWNQALRLFR